jgi:hypothetical protein
LNWYIVDYPEWGEWTFTPISGNELKPEDGISEITFIIEAPDVQKTTFSGSIKIVNSDNSSDYIEIPIVLTTPKIRFIELMLDWINERFPILYEILFPFFIQ